ncbi:MAG: SurA N-terminal domain-containing protein [Coriobacteriia bacterium]|nr:SurA N-terminal domain-containing protein [Coriobacteriia bacterium]
MNIKGIAKFAGIAALTAACVFGATACGSGEQVAATVNGQKILEQTITDNIQAYRTAYGMEDDATWGEYLNTYGYTPATIRESMIDSYVKTEIVKEQAKENGVTVDSSEVDAYVDQIKVYYEDDAAWQEALESAGITEQEYRESIETRLMEQALMDKVTPLTDPDDSEVLTYVSMYATYSYDGAKKSSQIVFASTDTDTAQSVLDQINAGTLSFEDAAKQYSTDTATKNDGGNIGWDCLVTVPSDAYTTALDALEAGQVSGLVEDTDDTTGSACIRIIKCTEVFTAPDEITDLSQVPTEMVDSVREMVKTYAQQDDFDTWLNEKQDEADVVINDMPSGLPYDVDMSAYENTANTTADVNTAVTDNTNTTEATNENANATATDNTNSNENTNAN